MKYALAFLIAALPLVAQDSVTVKQVNDRRTKGSFSQLTVGLELPKVKASDVAASRVLIAAAKDDAGRNLIDSEASEPQFEPNEPAATPLSVDVVLKNPDRKATKLTEVRGEIQMLMPSKDPNSVAEIPQFLSTSGKTLTHKALKANGVEIAVISDTQREAEKKKLSEAKKKEAKAAGYDDADANQLAASVLEQALKTEEGEVLVKIKDPNKVIQQIVYIDGSGETKRISLQEMEGFNVFATWGEKPKADWKLRVSMKTAKNVVKQPFALTNVPLP